MLYTGLTSVTFRGLSVPEIITLAADAGLDGIEWGGDIHVPHGELETARRVGELTREQGLAVTSYGAYYRLGAFEGRAEQQREFAKVLASAVALQAPVIRLWAGKQGSQSCENRLLLAEEAVYLAGLAREQGIGISFEYHGGTLTDTPESARRFYEEAKGVAGAYWQPAVNCSVERRLEGLQAVTPWLTNLHVFQWAAAGERLPLSQGEAEWAVYLDYAAKVSGDRYCILEFVREDSPKQFLEDAAALKRWVQARN